MSVPYSRESHLACVGRRLCIHKRYSGVGRELLMVFWTDFCLRHSEDGWLENSFPYSKGRVDRLDVDIDERHAGSDSNEEPQTWDHAHDHQIFRSPAAGGEVLRGEISCGGVFGRLCGLP